MKYLISERIGVARLELSVTWRLIRPIGYHFHSSSWFIYIFQFPIDSLLCVNH